MTVLPWDCQTPSIRNREIVNTCIAVDTMLRHVTYKTVTIMIWPLFSNCVGLLNCNFTCDSNGGSRMRLEYRPVDYTVHVFNL